MNPRPFLAACIAALLCASPLGCSEAIPLGSECAEQDVPCSSLPGPLQPPAEYDARAATERDLDAAIPRDSGAPPPMDGRITASPEPSYEAAAPSRWGILPDFRNPSFELDEGYGPGEITTINGSLPGAGRVAPWFTCQLLGLPFPDTDLTAVRALTEVAEATPDGGVSEPIFARHGLTFISVAALSNAFFPLIQLLDEPLREGTHYSFAIDVRALSDDPELRLEVQSAAEGCFPQKELDATPPVSAAGWQTMCFDFTTDEPHSILFLQVTRGGLASELPAFTGRLLFDNIREASDEECP